MISVAEIRERYIQRAQLRAKALQEMRELADAYENRLTVALPELDRNEPTAVANLIQQGLDQKAMRIASSLPDVFFPATNPGQTLAEKRARISRQAVLGWWDNSLLDLQLGQRARWLIGYACAPVKVCWDDLPADSGGQVPRWEPRDPATAFPSQLTGPHDVVPDDCIFAYRRSRGWLTSRYPGAMARLAKGDAPDAAFEVMEYVDSDEIVLCVAGEQSQSDRGPAWNGQPLVELERIPNRAGVPLVSFPTMIGLRRSLGQFNGMIGLYQQQAKLMALEYIAVVRGVFPPQYVVGRPNEVPGIVSIADPMRGIPGQIKGGTLETINLQPGYKTDQTIDRLERYERLTGGIPSEFGGESTTNVRTGRRGDQILSAAIDFPVQEAQKILARALQAEVRMAVAVAKGYAGDEPRSFYVNAKGAKGDVTYTPNRDFPTDAATVTFAHAGSDENQLIVQVGQMLGIGLMSKQTGRRLVPIIDDPDGEENQARAEALEQALLAGIAQQVSSGALGPADVARIVKALREQDSTLEDAVLSVQEQKQTEQASSGAPGTPAGPVPPGSPQAQPGLAGPGAPPQAGVAGPIAPSPNEAGLAQLLGALKGGASNRVAAA